MSWLEDCKGSTERLAHYGFSHESVEYPRTAQIRQLALEACDYRYRSTSVVLGRIPYNQQPAKKSLRYHLNTLVKLGKLETKKYAKTTHHGGAVMDLWRLKQ
jgi:hypothetical protein